MRKIIESGIISNSELKKLKSTYKKGDRVELLKMNDRQAPPVGTRGTVELVDDIGTIHVRWDTGSGLGVAYGEDKCVKISEAGIRDLKGDIYKYKKPTEIRDSISIKNILNGELQKFSQKEANKKIDTMLGLLDKKYDKFMDYCKNEQYMCYYRNVHDEDYHLDNLHGNGFYKNSTILVTVILSKTAKVSPDFLKSCYKDCILPGCEMRVSSYIRKWDDLPEKYKWVIDEPDKVLFTQVEFLVFIDEGY